MNNVEKKMELELYLKLFMERLFYVSEDDMYDINKYYYFLKNSNNLIEWRGFPAVVTMKAHIAILNERLKFLYDRYQLNPFVDSSKSPFKTRKDKFFFTQLCELLCINETLDLNKHKVNPLFFPLYIGLIGAFPTKYDGWENFKNRVKEISRLVKELMCDSIDKKSNQKNRELFHGIPIDKIYNYALDYYFPTTLETYFTTGEKHNSDSFAKAFDDLNIILEKFKLSHPVLGTITGQEQIFQNLLSSVEQDVSFTFPGKSQVTVSDCLDTATIEKNFIELYKKIYEQETILYKKLLAAKINVLISETGQIP